MSDFLELKRRFDRIVRWVESDRLTYDNFLLGSQTVEQVVHRAHAAEARVAELERLLMEATYANPDTQHGDGPLKVDVTVRYAGSRAKRT